MGDGWKEETYLEIDMDRGGPTSLSHALWRSRGLRLDAPDRPERERLRAIEKAAREVVRTVKLPRELSAFRAIWPAIEALVAVVDGPAPSASAAAPEDESAGPGAPATGMHTEESTS